MKIVHFDESLIQFKFKKIQCIKIGVSLKMEKVAFKFDTV